MPLRNSRGSPVDPVPFLVASLLGVLVCYAYGPIYFKELGLSLRGALLTSTAVAAAVTVASYYRYVWTARPDLRDAVPGTQRFRRLVYAMLVGLALLVLLALPLL